MFCGLATLLGLIDLVTGLVIVLVGVGFVGAVYGVLAVLRELMPPTGDRIDGADP